MSVRPVQGRRMVARLVRERIVLVGLVLMVVRIVLVGRDPLAGSDATRVRTLVSSVPVAPAPSARRRAVRVARCRLPISGRSL